MLIIVGSIIVTISLIVGFLMAGGNLMVLVQPAEFVTIGGAAIGSFLIAASMDEVKKVMAAIKRVITHKHHTTEDNLHLFKALYELFLLAQRDGLLALEKHIEDPAESDILSTDEKLIENEYATNFLCDTLKVMLSGGVPPHDVEILMDIEIKSYKTDVHPAHAQLTKLSDAFPALGIVAAVLGIIVTMGSINAGAAAVGAHVAAALVGTFLGILLSYGYVGPLATSIEHMMEGDVLYLETIKECVMAYAKGNPPIVAVEIGRRTLMPGERPSFSELENYLRGKGE